MAERGRIPRRWKVVLWIVAAVTAVIGGLLLALVLSTPSSPAGLAPDVPPKVVPTSWASSNGPAVEPPGVQTDGTLPGAILPYVTTGRLALLANGKPFGEEMYELRIAEEGTTLTSGGRFWFKVVLATVQITFEQTLEAERDLHPILYAAQFHAPFGFDRSVRATVAGDRLVVERPGLREEIKIDPDRTFTLGTFSTYALLPRLFALRQDAGLASFEVLVFGGPPSQEASAASDALPLMTVRWAGTAQLRAGDIVLDVDRYRISSTLGETDLYARGDEFLALRAGDGRASLWVYRADFFPDGVQVGGEAPLP
jgi:hypothetical protein